MNKINNLIKRWLANNLFTLVLMLAVFFGTHHFFEQEQQALNDVLRQFEVLKLKLSLTME